MNDEEEFEVGVKELGIKVKARVGLDPITEKKDIRLEFGRPSVPTAYFDLKALDDFIDKLQKLKQKLKEALE